MAENLNYGTLTAIDTDAMNVPDTGAERVALRSTTDDALVEKLCRDNSETYCSSLGGLYQFAEAMALPSACNDVSTNTTAVCTINSPHVGICPSGWHIPSEDEWNVLLAYAEGSSSQGGYTIAGYVLKSTSTDWGYPGIDTYKFGVLPTGGMYPETPGGFGDFGRFANIWAAGGDVANTVSEFDGRTVDGGNCVRMVGCTDSDKDYCTETNAKTASIGASCPRYDGSSLRCIQD